MTDNDREVRAARNESIFRKVNERISVVNKAFAEITDVYEIACECSNITCISAITIGPDEYLAVRQSPRRFVVLPDHVAGDVELVVSKHDGYTVVEKQGEAGELATDHAEPPD